MVAIELFRFVSTVNDLGLADLSLSFVRNKEQQEVDFLITERNAPVLLVEAKLSEDHPSAALVKFQKQLSVPAVQLTDGGETHRRIGDDILIAPAHQWLARLP